MSKMICDLSVGSFIKFGRFSAYGEAPQEIRWIKVHKDNTLLTEFIERLGPFDAMEEKNPKKSISSLEDKISEAGNNDYALSNIRQYLNSVEKQWYKPTHEYDEPPIISTIIGNTGLLNSGGFLSDFSKDELNAILNTEIITATINNIFEITNDKVFIPSKTNVTGLLNIDSHSYLDGVEEGVYWDYFKAGASLRVSLSQQCKKNFDKRYCYYDRDERNFFRYWWLRSPKQRWDSLVRVVDDGNMCMESVCQQAYNSNIGIRPALILKSDTKVSEHPDEEGYYRVVFE